MKTSYNNGKDQDINQLSKNEQLDAIHEWAEGSQSLENLLRYCLKNSIPTHACCAGHPERAISSSYIAFKRTDKNSRYIDKLLEYGYDNEDVCTRIGYRMNTDYSMYSFHFPIESREKYFNEVLGVIQKECESPDQLPSKHKDLIKLDRKLSNSLKSYALVINDEDTKSDYKIKLSALSSPTSLSTTMNNISFMKYYYLSIKSNISNAINKISSFFSSKKALPEPHKTHIDNQEPETFTDTKTKHQQFIEDLNSHNNIYNSIDNNKNVKDITNNKVKSDNLR